jgi:hypothetical protein
VTISEATLDAAVAGFLSQVADTISAPLASRTRSVTIPNGAWGVVYSGWDDTDASDAIAISDSGSHTWTALHAYTLTNRYAVWGWYNNTGSGVTISITVTWTFAFNGKATMWIGAITGASSTTPAVAATISNISTAEATATPSQVGSLFCLHYFQKNPSADISSLDSGSASDTSPLGHAYSSGQPDSGGTIYRTSPATDTTTPLTVGAAAPTNAQTYGVLIEYFPPPSGAPPVNIHGHDTALASSIVHSTTPAILGRV